MALKLLAHSESRPQDLADLHALAAVATPEDWTVARDAARLITERGYNRGRDLLNRAGATAKRPAVTAGRWKTVPDQAVLDRGDLELERDLVAHEDAAGLKSRVPRDAPVPCG
jgi:hypothetical protein